MGGGIFTSVSISNPEFQVYFDPFLNLKKVGNTGYTTAEPRTTMNVVRTDKSIYG